jgi:putative spermidine/putrescine transport system permease protein
MSDIARPVPAFRGSPSSRTRAWIANRFRVNRWAVLAIPLVAFLGAFFVLPTLTILLRSLSDFSPPEVAGLDNYAWFFDSSTNLVVLRRTLIAAFVVTGACLLVGYPYAYLMTTVGPRLRALLLGIVIISGFTSFMVRNYAWLVILQDNGPLNDAIAALGLSRVRFIGSDLGVTVAFTQILLPLMILPLYATMRGIDRRLLMAGASLGARPIGRFFSIYLPLSMPGVMAGALLVFVLTLGFYVTPALIGSPTHALFSQLMQIQVSQLLAWGHVGAMAVALTLVTLTLLAICALAARRWRVPEQEGGNLGLRTPEKGRRLSAGRAALWAICAITVLGLIAPMLIVFPQGFAGEASIAFPPDSWSTQWYSNFFSDPIWTDSLVRSLGVGIVSTLLATVLGCMGALALVRGRFPGKTLVGGLIVTPMILPLVVFAVGVYAVFLDWRLVGTFEGFVLAHTALAVPLVVVIVGVALRTFDTRLEDAAASLGAGRLKTFATVTLPVLLPSILTGALFAFLTSFDEVLTSVFISSPTVSTLPVEMYRSVLRGADPTIAAAASLILVATAGLMICIWQLRRLSHA